MDFIKIKDFHPSKDTFKSEKTSHRLGRSICTIPNWWRTCSRIIRKQIMQLKMGKRFEKVPAQHRYTTSQYGHGWLVIREIKATMEYHCRLTRISKIEKTVSTSLWDGRMDSYTLLVGVHNGTVSLKKCLAVSYKVKCMPIISSVQFSSVAPSCPTLCNPMNHSTPGLNPAISLLGIHPRETEKYVHTKTCVQMFIAKLF